MLKKLRGRTNELSENLKKGKKPWKKPLEMKNIKMKMMTTLEGINIRSDEAKEWITNLEDEVAENTCMEKQKEEEFSKLRLV